MVDTILNWHIKRPLYISRIGREGDQIFIPAESPVAMNISYGDSGVDIDAIDKSRRSIGDLVRSSWRGHAVMHGFGHYAGLVDIGGGRLLATHTDGVGTKIVISSMMKRYDTIGIDCVAMNVNDIICVGAVPVSFVDYIAAGRNDQSMFEQIAKGLAQGARQAVVPIVGGETAIMPGLYDADAFDLAGMVTGLVEQESVVLGDDIQAGDTIVGAYSSGLHSNGYSLVRKALFPKYSIHDTIRGIGCLGDILLEPTRIYVQPVLEILQSCRVNGLAHITGGSFTKLGRLGTVGFDIESLPPEPPIMELVASQGVESAEMYRTFNMGVGFCVISPPSEADQIIQIFKRHGIPSSPIGHTSNKQGVRVNSILL